MLVCVWCLCVKFFEERKKREEKQRRRAVAFIYERRRRGRRWRTIHQYRGGGAGGGENRRLTILIGCPDVDRWFFFFGTASAVLERWRRTKRRDAATTRRGAKNPEKHQHFKRHQQKKNKQSKDKKVTLTKSPRISGILESKSFFFNENWTGARLSRIGNVAIEMAIFSSFFFWSPHLFLECLEMMKPTIDWLLKRNWKLIWEVMATLQ